MDAKYNAILAFISGWAAVITSIWLLFEKADEVLSSKTKAALTSWLNSLTINNATIRSWPSAFIEIIDRLFGRKYLAWRCFLISVLFSFFWIGVISLLFYSVHPNLINKYSSSEFGLLWNVYVFIFAALVNGIIDYSSLLATRRIVSLMHKGNTRIMIGLLLLDLVFTYAIFVVLFIVLGVVFYGLVFI